MGSTVSVAACKASIFWLNASSVVPALGTGTDVGAVGVAGSDSYSNTVYTVTGAGADIGETVDAFHFVSTAISGNATITAQVLTQTASSSLAQAGVMIRDGASASAAFAAVVRTPRAGVRFVYRTTAGAAAAWVAVPDPLSAVYVKLTRSGNNISGYYSTDGITWTQIGSTQSIAMSSPQAGLAVSSHSTTATSTATFGNITLNTAVAPTVATAASASAKTVTGTSVNLSVLGADAGGESGLTYTWTLLGTLPDQVTYSANGTNAAKNTTVIFATAGTYSFLITIQNASGATATSTITVTVTQTPTSMSVSAATNTLPDSGTELNYATELDQFGMPLKNPSTVTWSIASGGLGTIAQTGLYSAPSAGTGSAVVQATSGTLTASTTVAIQSLGIFTGEADVGAPSPAGSASFNSSTSVYAVSGSGSDVYGTGDQFHYLYEPLTGDGTITAYIASETDTNSWTKSGLMFRDSLSADAAYAFLIITPTTTNGTTFQYRGSDGASAAQNTQTKGAGTAAPGWLRLVRTGNTFTAYLSTNGTTWTAYGTSQSIPMGSTIYVGLAVCSHLSGSLATATFSNVTITQTSRTFAANEDIGSPSPLGSYSDSSGAVTLTAGGSDIWGTGDQFQYGYNEITGSGSITLEVDSITNTNQWTKAGIMIRNTLTAGSANAAVFLTPGEGVAFQWRSSAGGSTSQTQVTGITAPYWLPPTDSNNSFTASYSSNGSTWTQVGSAESVAMNADVFAGVALTSRDSGTLARAVFNNIASTFTLATIPPPKLLQAITTSANPVTGKTALLTAVASDSIEGNSSLTYTWTALGDPPGNLTFSGNGTNSAASTTVTFTAAGAYLLQVVVQDPDGLQASATLPITVNQTASAIVVTPATLSLGPGASQTFWATQIDQFGNPMATQPTFAWSASTGSINASSGVHIAAPNVAGTSNATITATASSMIGNATVSLVNQSPLMTLSSRAIAFAGSSCDQHL